MHRAFSQLPQRKAAALAPQSRLPLRKAGAGGCGGAPESVASGATARSVSRWHRVVPPPDNEAEWQQLDLDEAEDV